MDLWPTTIVVRRQLLATFERLDGDQWKVPSLSEGWSRGEGREVTGTLADLTLTAGARRARLDHLEVGGMPSIRTWLAA